MIVDTSAIMAVILEEPEAIEFAEAIERSPLCLMSAGSWIELTAVLVRKHPNITREDLMSVIRRGGISIAPVTLDQAEIGEAAYRQYGRGTGHPAKLNFGDCFAYALARATGEPLLFKGDDFGRTDIVAA